ncbi:MAG: electron transport complex protein RnfA, partial [Ruminococcaceae bacterium]|nr:electron transport complex protein RnfA [Oscillospiraceae bacterium]
QHFVLDTMNLGYMQTIVFILVIAALVQFIEMALKKFIPSLHKALGVYLPLITTNCAVLGVAINNIGEHQYNFIQSIINSLGVGLGFMLAMVLFSGMRQKIQESEIPESFKGLPATLIAASFISLAFMGFGGIIENLFK